MAQLLQPTPADDLPIRKSIRRLRWFANAFEDQVQRTSAETGNIFETDRAKLSAIFLEWLKAFEQQKPTDDADRLHYVGFAAGLMLKTLIRHNPVRLISKPDGADASNPAYFWPEGYLYVAFCLNVRALVLEQDFHEKQSVVPELSEIRTWWTFRENTEEDPSLAVAFLDLFAGDEPQWTMPDIFQPDRLRKIATRYYDTIEDKVPPDAE